MRYDFLKKNLHWIGSGLGVLGVVFVAIKLAEYSDQIKYSEFNAGVLLAAAGLAVFYSAANLLLALAWYDLLKHVGIVTERHWAIRTFGLSQLAKYVPGNIFHLAGRQTIGVAKGLPGWPLARSALWELSVISVAGGFFSLLILPLFFKRVSNLLALTTFLILVFICAWIVSRWFSTWVARAYLLYTVFLGFSGIIFIAILSIVSSNLGVSSIDIAICGSYVIAWLAGLLTPGAPAGVGVRELVLYALLHSYVSEADLLVAILLGRMVTVCGDLIFYLTAAFAITDVKRKFFRNTLEDE